MEQVVVRRDYDDGDETLYDVLLEDLQASHFDILRTDFDLTYHELTGHPDVRCYWLIVNRMKTTGKNFRRLNIVWPSGRIVVDEVIDGDRRRYRNTIRGTELSLVEATLRGLL